MANSVASVLKNFAARSEIANWNIDGRCAKRPRSALSHWLGGREASILRPPSPNPATGRRHWRLPGNRGSHMISTQNGAFLRGLWRRVGGELREGGEEREEEGIFFFLFFLFFIVPISFDLSDCYPPCSWGCSIQPPSPLAAPTAFLYVVTVTRWESHQRLADIKPQLADTTFPDH